ncbi:hypothetical protein K0U83_23380 [bacterium]|nr:hypothetical protein [bacterium]
MIDQLPPKLQALCATDPTFRALMRTSNLRGDTYTAALENAIEHLVARNTLERALGVAVPASDRPRTPSQVSECVRGLIDGGGVQ